MTKKTGFAYLWHVLFLMGAVLVLSHCGTFGADCPVGGEGCECTPGGACDPGLACRSNLCVDDSGSSNDGNNSDNASANNSGGTNASTLNNHDETNNGGGGCDLAPAEGTHVDETNCLMWSVADYKSAFAEQRWYTAPEMDEYCDGLDFGGFDDWRSPNLTEVRTIIRGCPETESGGSCRVTATCTTDLREEGQDSAEDCYNSDCRACFENETPPPEGQSCFWDEEVWGEDCLSVWTSTIAEGVSNPDGPERYYVRFTDGLISRKWEGKSNWEPLCVRGPR